MCGVNITLLWRNNIGKSTARCHTRRENIGHPLQSGSRGPPGINNGVWSTAQFDCSIWMHSCIIQGTDTRNQININSRPSTVIE